MDSDPTPGNPEEIRELAEDLQEFADDVGEALGKIRGMASDRAVADWSGLSADAFRAEFDGVPENLTKLRTSYDMAADALARYWPRLENAQGMADRALESAIAAQDDLRAAQSELGDAQDWVSRAGEEAERLQDEGESTAAEPPDEQAVRDAVRDHQAAEDAAGAAQSRVDAAEQRLAAARELAGQARELREEAARECARDIDAASDAGIQNRSWWEDAVNWVTENWDTFVDICKLVVAVLGIVVMIIGGPLAWVVLAAALVVLADTLVKYAQGRASLFDVAFAALDCIPGMKGLTTLGGLAAGLRGLATTGLRGISAGVQGVGQGLRHMGREFRRLLCRNDPIDMATGDVVMSVTDLALSGRLDLAFRRYHRSGTANGRWLGRAWFSTLDQRLVLDAGGVRFFAEDGMVLHYPVPLREADTPVMPVEGPRWGLSWNGNAHGTLAIHQDDGNRTLHFAPVDNNAGRLPLVAVTDPNGNRIDVHHDADGIPTEIRHSGGYRLGLTVRDQRLRDLVLLSDPQQPVLRRYEYDARGELSGVRDSSGTVFSLRYDGRRRITGWRDRNGNSFAYQYDDAGRCVATGMPDGTLASTIAYAPETGSTTYTNSLGQTTTFQFDDAYRLVSETDPLGHVTHYSYDRHDNLLRVTDPLGRTTEHTYDAWGQLVWTRRPDGGEVSIEYAAPGLEARVVEADGSVRLQTFDAAGNRTSYTDPAGATVRYGYDERGMLESITDPSGATTRIECDAAGLPVRSIDSLGQTFTERRDAFGRPVLVEEPDGAVTRLRWDGEGRLAEVVDPTGQIRAWEYDGQGNCVAYTDESGATQRAAYNAFGQRISSRAPDGTEIRYDRDSELRLTRVVGPDGQDWERTYDAAGRLVAERDFDGREITYVYDAAGQLISRTNALGQYVRYRRDPLGRIAVKDSEGTRTEFRYDRLGRLMSATAPGSDLRLERDAVGRVVAEHYNDRTLRQTYDAAGRLVSRTTPAGHHSALTYDATGRRSRLVSDAVTTEFAYDAVGREVGRRLHTGLELRQEWASNGRLTAQTLMAPDDRVSERRYIYGENGLLRELRDDVLGRLTLDTDPLGRITAVTGDDWSERYTYDRRGYQTSATWSGAGRPGSAGERTYEGSRLVRAGATTFGYDRAGRTVRRSRRRISHPPRVWHYTWDAEDQLTEVRTPDGATWEYRYDPLGRRVAKWRRDEQGETTEHTTYVWAGATLVEQTEFDSTATRRTTSWDYLGDRPVAQTVTAHAPGDVGTLGDVGNRWDDEQRVYDREFYSIVTDLVGTPTRLVDTSGDIVWRNHTSVWGVPADSRSDTADDGAVECPLRFPGQVFDAESGLHYNRYRYYDPAVARYYTPDPLGPQPQINHYGYVPNPLHWKDPLGLEGDGDGYLYRGICRDHPRYAEGLQGRAVPLGGDADAASHNGGNTNSNLTSWTTDFEGVALDAADEMGPGGFVLRIPEGHVPADRLVESPDIYEESEYLIRDEVTDAEISTDRGRSWFQCPG
ncbi:RHS repeat-associated core domain-containing protein [Streptomyces litchfieldiae]|uniref:RHS repeat-associated core domain-containing protein n=1 Tax=Streptomyces litchfieldiae TaxID=3075543 RepID=A0ABU2N1I1_9ACTN|nr:RHS repeat-associated core domain-containing protein [Streptomyces sp. DSM 44938]MDT0347767.1 RHS repeat-associated core domain-containing protein [Streptomyces sp. DSM 44938]